MKTGQYIKEARIRKGMTQEELALETGINIRTIQRIENGEVIPRSYSLRTIAEMLGIDPLSIPAEKTGTPVTGNRPMLVALHLSGLLLLPAIMIWYFEKDRVKGVEEHGADVINFQLSMLVILLPLLFVPFLAILLALFTLVVVLLNTCKVLLGKPYYYPMRISFLKKKELGVVM
jgi:transcriptional regulator with XRE-family HTH domain